MGGWLVQVVSNGGFLLGSHRTFSITTNYLGHETFYSTYCINVIVIHQNNQEKQLYLWLVGMCSDNILLWRLSCLFRVAVYSWRAVWGHDILPWHICWCCNCRQTWHYSVLSWRFHHSLFVLLHCGIQIPCSRILDLLWIYMLSSSNHYWNSAFVPTRNNMRKLYGEISAWACAPSTSVSLYHLTFFEAYEPQPCAWTWSPFCFGYKVFFSDY